MRILYRAFQFGPKDGVREVEWVNEQVVAQQGFPVHVRTGMAEALTAPLGHEVVRDERLPNQLWFGYPDPQQVNGIEGGDDGNDGKVGRKRANGKGKIQNEKSPVAGPEGSKPGRRAR